MKHIADILQNSNHPLLRSSDVSTGEEENMVGLLVSIGIPLPPFLEYPEYEEPNCVRYYPDAATPYFGMVGQDITSDSIVEIYDHFETRGEAVFFSESVLDAPGISSFGWQVLFAEHNGDPVMLVGKSKSQTWNDYANQFHRFLIVARDWMDNPEDVANACDFIQYHPAFWSINGPDHYIFDDGLSLVRMSVARDENEMTEVTLRTGGYAREHDYEDPQDNLEVVEESIDDAYITLAKLVDEVYNLLGQEIKN